MRQITKWFRVISVWLVPIVYLSLGVFLLIYNTKASLAFDEENAKLTNYYNTVV